MMEALRPPAVSEPPQGLPSLLWRCRPGMGVVSSDRGCSAGFVMILKRVRCEALDLEFVLEGSPYFRPALCLYHKQQE